MPKEERFHELLAEDTAQPRGRGAPLPGDRPEHRACEERRTKVAQLKALEHDGDKITREIFDALNSTFITPFDREDIRAIATDLDDILDYMEGVAQHLVLFELDESPEALRKFAEILVGHGRGDRPRHRADLGPRATRRRSTSRIVRISDLENEADAPLQHG